ncbi:MAG: hypothetical protein ACRDPT_16275 [Streptomycetales bacterium]
MAVNVFVTGEDGGILNDPVLLRLGTDHFWLSLADSDILLWARGLAYRSGLDVTIGEADVAPVQVQGPLSAAVMRDVFGDSVLDIGYYHLREYDLDGMRLVVSRTGYTAEVGYEIYVHNASSDGVRLWNTAWEAGRPHGMRVTGPCHIRRIEGGILAHGADITFDTNPFEVGMGYDWMVDLDQEGDFVARPRSPASRPGGWPAGSSASRSAAPGSAATTTGRWSTSRCATTGRRSGTSRRRATPPGWRGTSASRCSRSI